MSSVEFIIKARDEASAAIQKISGATTDLGSSLVNLSRAAGPWGAVAAGIVAAGTAIGAAAATAARDIRDMQVAASAAGSSVQDVQVVRTVFEQLGFAATDADKALQLMTRAVGRNSPVVRALGITAKDGYGALLQLSEALKGFDAGTRTVLAQSVMEEYGVKLAGVLGDLGNMVDTTREKMQASGGLFTDETIKKAGEFKTQLNDLKIAWDGWNRGFQSWSVPLATGFLTWLNEAGNAITRFVEAERDAGELQRELATTSTPAEAAAVRARVLAEQNARRNGTQTSFADRDRALNTRAVSVDIAAVNRELAKFAGQQAATMTDREKSIRAIIATLGVGRDAAVQFAQALDSAEQAGKAADTIKKLQAAGVTDDALRASGLLPEALPGLRGGTPRVPMMVDQMVELPDMTPIEELKKAFPDISEAMIDMGIAWGETVQSITSGAAVVNGGLQALFNGLNSGLTTVFTNLTNRTQTFRSAMKTIFSGLVQEVLALLARIVAAKVFAFILKLIPGIGTVAGTAIDVGTGFMGGLSSARRSGAFGATTVNIYAIDRAGVEAAFADPRGSLRRGGSTVALAGAY